MSKFKRKGCGPRALGASPIKKNSGGDPPEKIFTKENIRNVVKSGNTEMYYGPDGKTYNQDEFPWLNTDPVRPGSKDIYVSKENYPNKSIIIDNVDKDGTIHGRYSKGSGSGSYKMLENKQTEFVVPAYQKPINLPNKDWRSESKTPKLVNPFPEIYGRKIKSNTNEVIYDTSKGKIVTAKDGNSLKRLSNQKNRYRKQNTMNLPPMLDSDFQRTFVKNKK